MDELIKVAADKTVCARGLHEFLRVETQFSKWIQRRIDEYGFSQPLDFTLVKNDYNEIAELRLSVDVAKELCMVERTERGRQARLYFIEVEKDWRRVRTPTPLEALQGVVAAMVAQDQELRKQGGQLAVQGGYIAELQEKTKFLDSDTGYRTVSAAAKMLGLPCPRREAQKFGRLAAKACRDRGITIGKVPDERDGEVNSYPLEILKSVMVPSGGVSPL